MKPLRFLRVAWLTCCFLSFLFSFPSFYSFSSPPSCRASCMAWSNRIRRVLVASGASAVVVGVPFDCKGGEKKREAPYESSTSDIKGRFIDRISYETGGRGRQCFLLVVKNRRDVMVRNTKSRNPPKWKNPLPLPGRHAGTSSNAWS